MMARGARVFGIFIALLALLFTIPTIWTWCGINLTGPLFAILFVFVFGTNINAIRFRFIGISIVLFIVLMLEAVFQGKSISSISNEIRFYMPLAICYTVLVLLGALRGREIRIFSLVLTTVVVLRFVSAIIVDAVLPGTARMIAGLSIKEPQAFYRIGVGTYSLISGGVFLILPGLHMAGVGTRTKLLRVFIVGLAILSMIVTMWATPLIFAMLVLLIYLISNKRTGALPWRALIVIIVIVMTPLWIRAAVDELVQVSEGNMFLYDKAIDIRKSVYEGSPAGQAESRFLLYETSIRSIVRHPIFGRTNAVVGEHAFWLDFAARHGVFGLLLLLLVLQSLKEKTESFIPESKKWINNVNFILFLAFGFLKNISGYDFAVFLFLIGPLMMYEPSNDVPVLEKSCPAELWQSE